MNEITFNFEPCRCTIIFDGFANADEILTLLSIEEGVGIVFYYVAEFSFLLVFMLAALFQLFQFLNIHVLTRRGHFTS